MGFVALIARMLAALNALRKMFMSTRIGMWIAAAFVGQAGVFIVKLLKFTGVAIVVSKFAAPALLDYIIAPLTGLPDDWQAFLEMARVDESAGVMVTALSLRASERLSLKKRVDSNWGSL